MGIHGAVHGIHRLRRARTAPLLSVLLLWFGTGAAGAFQAVAPLSFRVLDHRYYNRGQFCPRPVASYPRPGPWSSSATVRLALHKDVELVLLDLPLGAEDETKAGDADTDAGNDTEPLALLALPGDHLPRALSTVHVYGAPLVQPLQRVVARRARDDHGGLLGQVATRPAPDTWVGAVGCAAQVLLLDEGGGAAAATEDGTPEPPAADRPDGNEGPSAVALLQGRWRFVITGVVSTIPYPVVIVDELTDEPLSTSSSRQAVEVAGGDDRDDSSAPYAKLSPSELSERLIRSMRTCVDQQVAALESLPEPSPLEQAILGDAVDLTLQRAAQKRAVEETAATLDAALASLTDFCPTEQEQYYCLSLLAVELAGLPNAVRRQCLVMTDTIERMRLVLQRLDQQIARLQAVRLTDLITQSQDEDERDLKVGEPTLPPWARQIRKGMRMEYYWNEEYGWCEAEVVEEPLFIVNEVLLTVFFPIDGTTHRLPVTAEDKVRWRPLR